MKSSPFGCAVTLPSTPIIQQVAGWDSVYHNFGVRQPAGLLVVRGLPDSTVRGASGSGSVRRAKLSTVVPDIWLQRIVGEGR